MSPVQTSSLAEMSARKFNVLCVLCSLIIVRGALKCGILKMFVTGARLYRIFMSGFTPR